ncbi:hypothetical protein [Desulfobulbus alkaliphilus]|uniref:hypothetical protein n=1 Tax=Desulfobulbus alkaliphilus TaxID=869814 RepID=UPI001966CB93|nr:hypothetical protein [Desulfobulbus alkaliphilus]MBM9538217.1 hypothetical protein [Desulfobulbus alkaliphilus]
MNKKLVLIALLFSFVISCLYLVLIENKAMVNLHLETERRTIFKIYWKKEGGNWTERRVATIVIDPRQEHYSFRLTNIARIAALRVDTSERPSTVTLKSLTIRQNGFEPIVLDTPEALSHLEIIEGIESVEVSEKGLTVVPATIDPQLLFTLPTLSKTPVLLDQTLRIACIFLVVFLLCWALHRVVQEYHFVSYCSLVVFVFILVMASLSLYNQHPDEPFHVHAGEYFQDHVFPPRIGDPSTLDSYSGYGVSRLHSGEIAYFFAGKFAKMLQPFEIPSYLALRYFNVALFFTLFVMTLNSYHFRLLMVPVLLSPQIWYIFSYVNSEAFALFIILVVAHQLVCPDSKFNRLVAAEKFSGPSALSLAALGMLFGFLLLLKINFYFYLLFVGLYIFWRFGCGTLPCNRFSFSRLAAIALIGLTLFGTVRGIDSYINDFRKSEKLLEVREQLANEIYNPRTPLERKHIYLHMRDRGVTLERFLRIERWGEKTFRSAFGVYGYTSISGSFNYYDYVRYTGLLLLVSVLAVVVVRGGWPGVSLLAVTLTSASALIAVAIYHAWTMDFQAQGRYLLPIVGMGAVFYAHIHQLLARPYFLLLWCGMFSLALYNFLFVGLRGVEKLSFIIV